MAEEQTAVAEPAVEADPWKKAPVSAPAAKPKPKAAGGLVMHFLVPVPKAPAPHMVSGEPPGLLPLAEALRQSIGNQGQAYAPACNPKLIMNERHRGTGEPWAILGIVDGTPVIAPSTCPACLETEAWKKAILENPHPRARGPEEDAPEGCC